MPLPDQSVKTAYDRGAGDSERIRRQDRPDVAKSHLGRRTSPHRYAFHGYAAFTEPIPRLSRSSVIGIGARV